MTDEPIEGENYRFGVTVVDIGDIRVSRGLTRRPSSSCRHKQLRYDPRERRIWCADCEKDVDSFDAFKLLTEQYHSALEGLKQRQARLVEAEMFQVRLIATKTIEKAWRSKSMVPACPSCQNGLFPEDFKREPAMLGKDYARARRRAIAKDTGGGE
jgi:hypothetical protein